MRVLRVNDVQNVPFDPPYERNDVFRNADADVRETVVDVRRNDGPARSVEHSIAFEIAQRRRKHLLGNPADAIAQFGKTQHARIAQGHENE